MHYLVILAITRLILDYVFGHTFQSVYKPKVISPLAIYNKFKEHNIEIPFPQQDVYIKDFPKPETENDK